MAEPGATDNEDSETIRLVLTNAMFHNDVSRMKAILVELSEAGFENELEAEASSARLLLQRLELKRQMAFKELLNVVCKYDIIEMKAYHNPPVSVQTVMTAVSMLLGFPEKQAKKWIANRRLLSEPTCFLQKLYTIDADCIPVSAAQRVKDITSRISEDICKNVSLALGGLYKWVRNITEFVLTNNRNRG